MSLRDWVQENTSCPNASLWGALAGDARLLSALRAADARVADFAAGALA